MKRYLIFSVIFIASIVLLSCVIGYIETRELSMASDFSKDLRIELPEYTYEQYEPEPKGPDRIGFHLVFKEPLSQTADKILKKGRKGWEKVSDTTYRLDRHTGNLDHLIAEINTSNGQADLVYVLDWELRNFPILSMLFTCSLIIIYVLISLIWLCCNVVKRIRSIKAEKLR